jgi:hypothetical protein
MIIKIAINFPHYQVEVTHPVPTSSGTNRELNISVVPTIFSETAAEEKI